MSAAIACRAAVPADVPVILRLIRELAEFEREPQAVVATEADLLRDGWGPSPRFGCLLAELDGQPCGFALWFFNYSTWLGRAGIYLEDLYVTPAARGHGVGARLVREVAALALRHGAARLDFNVLEWNPARGFYEKLGIKPTGWLPYRIAGEELARLAAMVEGPPGPA